MLQLEMRGHIAIVRLNRPDRRNALSFDLMRELTALAGRLRRDRALRAVVLCGAGESFCAGLDVAELGNRGNRFFVFRELLKPSRSLFQRMALVWCELPVPVIAAVHGHCLGGGLQLAASADIRIARADSQWAILEGRWGMVPDMGITTSLRGVLRTDIAKELTWSARIFDGAEAHRLGLVTYLADDPLAVAQALAGDLAGRSPDAVLAGKRVIDAMTHTGRRRALWLEKWWQVKLLLGRNSAVARARAKTPEKPWVPRQFD
ncbi:crotonase/enoyl-CoA hydratase family protein [Lysobacter pythonis]|uniref:Crotonase/enoyl-CoA hydratase family protein n=1 Tax=Solilutibacter pythonis TaxID=2483112 RepID=A0A3M2HYA4_9GAMM|nr:crotonase/enoyl-CoA hydratase family protein [Lysobacter pythonis]RMH93225.1 crotonase/enoyl-CoA hydratase family protein [Lysobacter pythonis]